MRDGQLTGRTAVVTGAATKEADTLADDGLDAVAVSADVADPSSVERCRDEVRDRAGDVDVLVNNAAVFATVPMTRADYRDIPVAEWDLMMAVNLRGIWLMARAFVPAMQERGYGKVVNISSGTALKGSASRIHYVTSKAGVIGFTKTLAREVGGDGVAVNCIAPGSTLSESDDDTEAVRRRSSAVAARAFSRVQRPTDLVGAVVFFASPASDFITGQTLVVDGGAYMH
jgi:3-oxoacyl-[acyl-carrier protein] reductase